MSGIGPEIGPEITDAEEQTRSDFLRPDHPDAGTMPGDDDDSGLPAADDEAADGTMPPAGRGDDPVDPAVADRGQG